MTSWQQFAMLADTWVVGYVHMPAICPPVCVFHAGHALELYLKAVFLKHNPGIDVKKKSHKISEMIAELKSDHPGFLPSVTLRSSVPGKFISGKWPKDVSRDPDYAHFVEHQELYWASEYLADLKYLGTVHNRAPECFSLFCRSANPYWGRLYGEIRRHLGWPINGFYVDAIRTFEQTQDLSESTKEFLRHLNG